MRITLPFLAVALTIGLSAPSAFADAKDLAEQIVARSGLSLGYDEDAKTFVFIGKSQRIVPDISDANTVMKLREEESKLGMLKAKAEILKLLVRDVSARSVATLFVSDGVTVTETSSAVDILSHLVLHGFQTICTAESYENGVLQTAVAIGWSEKSEMAARAALSSDSGRPADESPEEPSPEWEKWAQNQDLSAMVVSRSFEDSNGICRYVGIGFADVDGKTGKALKGARTLAFTKAKQNLLYALYSDAEARNLAVQILRSKSQAGSDDETETFRSSVRRISQTCKSVFLPNCGAPVYENTVFHPITGRKIYVCLAGVEPDNLVKMKLLGENQ